MKMALWWGKGSHGLEIIGSRIGFEVGFLTTVKVAVSEITTLKSEPYRSDKRREGRNGPITRPNAFAHSVTRRDCTGVFIPQ